MNFMMKLVVRSVHYDIGKVNVEREENLRDGRIPYGWLKYLLPRIVAWNEKFLDSVNGAWQHKDSHENDRHHKVWKQSEKI